jgi:hypothetical protein
MKYDNLRRFMDSEGALLEQDGTRATCCVLAGVRERTYLIGTCFSRRATFQVPPITWESTSRAFARAVLTLGIPGSDWENVIDSLDRQLDRFPST